MKQYLVVAHYDGDHSVVEAVIRDRVNQGPAQFVVLVPATPPRTRSLTWSEEQARKLAKQRLGTAMDAVRRLGAKVAGEIGSDSVEDAIGDSLRSHRYDEVILATPPPSFKDKILGDLGARLKQIRDIAVTHVIVPEARAL